jgi:23S rRNA pseudouridine1911/1915/1917 synthase
MTDESLIPAEDPLPPDAAPAAAGAPQDQPLHHIRYEIRHDLQKRVDLYLRDRLPLWSRAMLQRLVKSGTVFVNGKAAKSSTVLRAGDVIEATLPVVSPQESLPEEIPLHIIYEDDGFIALNKQANLIVHPARGHWSGTLINALLYHARATHSTLSTGSDPWRPGIIHRLDRDTTGLILVAKTDEAHWRLAGQFERRTIKKTYLALVHGIVELDSDLIDAPLATHPKIREKYAVRPEIGLPAQTVYTVLERFPPSAHPGHPHHGLAHHPFGPTYTLLELAPKTGRTHQLRVHLSHIGHPIVGDTAYGGRPITEADLPFARHQAPASPSPAPPLPPLITRQALHAFRLQFVHPLKFHRMTLEAPVPPDFQHILDLLRAACPT